MRYCFVALLLFAVLPLMDVLAAPAPAPFAILDIGPPEKGETAEEHRQSSIACMTRVHGGILTFVHLDPEVSKLKSVARLEDARPWLAQNLLITQDGEGNRLRLKFQAGTRTEQAAILNSLLRVHLSVNRRYCQQHLEKYLRFKEKASLETIKLMEKEPPGRQREDYRNNVKNLRDEIVDLRSRIAGLKQAAVIQWAK